MNITTGKRARAQKVVIYGPEGVGKSSLAAGFPQALFIDTEGSTDNMDVARLDKPTSWSMLMNQINWIKANPTVCKTLVIDTVDWAEQLAVESICATHGKKGIEDFGYGNGYVYAKEELGRFLNKLQELIEVGINVVLTAHAQIRKFEQPDEAGAYDRYELKLGKKTSSQTAPLVKEWADMVLFCNYKTFAVATDDKGKKFKAQGGQRVMYTEHHPAWDAKNRHGLPFELPLDFAGIAHIFNAPTKAAPTPVQPPVQQEVVSQAPIQNSVQEAPAPPIQQVSSTLIPAEAAQIPSVEIPKALRDLMIQNKVTEKEIQQVVFNKGHFPADMPIKDYNPEYIEGVLIGAWPQVLAAIEEDRKLPF